MSFVRAGSLAKLAPGSMTCAHVNGCEIALANVGGEIRAFGNTCPHEGGPLAEGALHGNMVVCPWHAWEYDVRTGENDYDPSVRTPVYPVRIEGDDILVDTGSESAAAS